MGSKWSREEGKEEGKMNLCVMARRREAGRKDSLASSKTGKMWHIINHSQTNQFFLLSSYVSSLLPTFYSFTRLFFTTSRCAVQSFPTSQLSVTLFWQLLLQFAKLDQRMTLWGLLWVLVTSALQYDKKVSERIHFWWIIYFFTMIYE